MLYLSTTKGVYRVNPETGDVDPLGPPQTSTESLAVTGDVILAGVTPDYGVPMRTPLSPAGHRGAVRSDDAGQSWHPLEDGLAGQQVTALASLHATGAGHSGGAQGAFIAGTDPAQLLISQDAGASWARGQSLEEMPGYEDWSYPAEPHTPHVMVIEPHPTVADTIFAGIEVGGIVRSDDGGATWRVTGEGCHPDIHGLAISASDPQVVYASTPQGVFVSEDGGEHFVQRIQGLEPLYCRPIVVHPADPDRAVVVATNGASGFFGIPAERTGGTVLRTADRGRTWHRVTAGLPQPLAPTPAMVADGGQDPARVYLPLFSGEVYVSEDSGETWRELARGLPPILRATVA